MSDIEEELNDARLLIKKKNPKLTKGFRLFMPFTMPGDRWNMDRSIWLKHGFSREMNQWLLDNIGKTGSYQEWEEEHPDVRWLHTGSNLIKLEAQSVFGHREVLIIRFREKSDAMMFKLAWWNRQ